MKLTSQHNIFKYNIKVDGVVRDIFFSSKFDSGNLGKV